MARGFLKHAVTSVLESLTTKGGLLIPSGEELLLSATQRRIPSLHCLLTLLVAVPLIQKSRCPLDEIPSTVLCLRPAERG